MKNWVINLFLLISLVGVLDSFYLTHAHFSGGSAGCFLIHGCDIVLKSSYSAIFGVPVAVLGVFFYLVLFLGMLVFNFNQKDYLLRFLGVLTIFGFLTTLSLLYIQAFVLEAFCLYCLLSSMTSTLLFLIGIYMLRLRY